MGSGARAYRMAAGSIQAEQKSYLSELQAGKEDVSDILAGQKSEISKLLDSIKGQRSSPITIQAVVDKAGETNYRFLFPIVIIVTILFLMFKK